MRNIILLDGGMGQELLKRSRLPLHPLWSAQILMQESELVQQVHVDFIRSGAKIITLNTYAATPERLERDGASGMFDELHNKAIEVAQKARDICNISDVRIAGCLPPLYGSYKPDQAPPFEECVERYQVIANKQSSQVDLFICETMSSIKEAKAAITAATAHKIETWCSLSIKDGKDSVLRSNEKLSDAILQLDKLSHDANLLNCSIPEAITVSLTVIKRGEKRYGAYANGFTSIGALDIGGTVDVLKARKDLGPEIYSKYAIEWLKNGAKIIGGCCEISPSHIEHIREKLIEHDYNIVSSLND